MSEFRFFRFRAWRGAALAAAVLVACGAAQAGEGATQAAPAESAPVASAEAPAKKQAVHCMWQDKGVTGFCAVGAGTKLGAACACTTIIEHKTRKFPGKVVVMR